MAIKFAGELLDCLDQGLGIFFLVKDQIGNIVDFVGHIISFVTIHPCHCSVKASKENMSTNGCGCVPIKLYLQKYVVGKICSTGHIC